jgi:hypothetical protein
VGEPAWFRNFMQSPVATQDHTFTEAIIEKCLNYSRSVVADCPMITEEVDGQLTSRMTPVTVTVDPALGGGNAVMALGFHPKRLLYLASRVDWGFTRNEQIFDVIEEFIIRWNQPGVSWVDQVIVEAMAFQKGLLTDERMQQLIDRYGINVVPHLTGNNKYDENIGVASMAMDFRRGDIDLPYADEPSRREVDLMLQELYAWKPYKRGNRLRQDRVMAKWFGWIRWKIARLALRAQNNNSADQFKSRPSPLRESA